MEQETFEKELAELRERLEEAEDVRRAITRGEVDAFVIGPGGSGRVLLLANAYQRYRQLVERMSQGAVTSISAPVSVPSKRSATTDRSPSSAGSKARMTWRFGRRWS